MKTWIVLLFILNCAQLGTGSRTQESSITPVLFAVAPTYPPAGLGLRHGDQAVVEIEVTINSRGDVSSAKPLRGLLLFYEASIKAARRWRFSNSEASQKAKLTFVFHLLAPTASPDDAVPVFVPPYRVEVSKISPEQTITPGAGADRRKKQKQVSGPAD